MINFITQHGDERVRDIQKDTDEQFGVEKGKLMEAERKLLSQRHE